MSDLYRWDENDITYGGRLPIDSIGKGAYVTYHDALVGLGCLVPVEPVDRVWFCSYNLPLKWEHGDFACNPDNPRQGNDCDERCGWYLMVKEDDGE